MNSCRCVTGCQTGYCSCVKNSKACTEKCIHLAGSFCNNLISKKFFLRGGRRFNKGCTCKRSECKKKYCVCFQKQIPCTACCECSNCRNTPTETDREDDDDDVSEPESETEKRLSSEFAEKLFFRPTLVIMRGETSSDGPLKKGAKQFMELDV